MYTTSLQKAPRIASATRRDNVGPFTKGNVNVLGTAPLSPIHDEMPAWHGAGVYDPECWLARRARRRSRRPVNLTRGWPAQR